MRTDEQREYQRNYMREYRKRTGCDDKRRYGITKEERSALLERQDGVCAICPDPATDLDHCHSSGAVRGLLCRRCNTALGLFRDSPSLLNKAAKYLNGRSVN